LKHSSASILTEVPFDQALSDISNSEHGLVGVNDMPVENSIQRDIDVILRHNDLASDFLNLNLDINAVNTFSKWIYL
jgi:hypothetical protein